MTNHASALPSREVFAAAVALVAGAAAVGSLSGEQEELPAMCVYIYVYIYIYMYT